MLKYFEACIRKYGDCIGAQHATHALSILASAPIDLVLSDVEGIGSIDGFKLCREIRKDKRYQDIPIILTSSRRKWEFRGLGVEAGADGILCQPFTPKQLYKCINSLREIAS